MKDKNIRNNVPLNDNELQNVSGGTDEETKPETNPYDTCRICGGDMIAARVTDYSPFDILPACVCRKCGHEEY